MLSNSGFRLFAVGCPLVLSLLGGETESMKLDKEKIFRVGYPLGVLRKEQTLLDPANLSTTFEYYLLENLAVGLVRDSKSSPSGFDGMLAESWIQPEPSKWELKLRADLKWSDGSAISGEEIVTHIKTVSSAESRHLVVLKTLSSATYDSKSRVLRLIFKQPVGRSVLQELSLSDAVLLHPTNRTKGWAITSGPYTVEGYDSDAGRLILSANRFSPLIQADSPRRIELIRTRSGEKRDFKSDGFNLVAVSFPAFQDASQSLVKMAPKVARGVPATIFFFEFCGPENGTIRREFSFIIQKAFKSVNLSAPASHEDQLIPLGYAGRLASYSQKKQKIQQLMGKTLKINLHPAFRERGDILEKMKATGEKHGVHFEFVFSPLGEEPKGAGLFAKLYLFRGNQKDALGSWSFLFSENGPLGLFRKEVEQIIQQAGTAASEDEREQILGKLHRRALDEAYAVPFMIEPLQLAVSEDVDLSNFNPYDMRYRFYDIRWKSRE